MNTDINILATGDTTNELMVLYAHLDRAWQLYINGEEIEAIKEFLEIKTRYHSRIVKAQRKPKSKSKIAQTQAAFRILSFDHPDIQGITDNVRGIFSLAIARNWLGPYPFTHEDVIRLDEHILKYYYCFDPLAVIIGSEFTFQIDIDAMGKQTYGGYYQAPLGGEEDPTIPIKYEECFKLFPEFALLNSLTFDARKIFLSAIMYAQDSSGLVESEQIYLYNPTIKRTGVDDLVNVTLLDKNPDHKSLLMLFTKDELRQIASERRLPSHGTKYQIAELLVQDLDYDIIEKMIFSKSHGKALYKPLVTNFPLLKKYIRAEINKIKLYLTWLDRYIGKQITPREYTVKEIQSMNKAMLESQHSMDMYSKPNDFGLLDDDLYHCYMDNRSYDNERMLVKEYWDENCDEIIKSLADKYAWYVHSQSICLVSNALSEYFPPETIAEFRKRCDELHIISWKWALANYGSMCLFQMKHKIRQPRILSCQGCGADFIEWSVRGWFASRVNFNIQFCNHCYGIVLLDQEMYKPLELPDAEMLEALRTLCIKIESIPNISFMRKPNFDAYDVSKQIEVIRHMIKMPSYKQYVRIFGSWLRSLILSGALDRDTRIDQGRGYQCLAKDGHVCLSLAEKVIDDWLTDNNIGHVKEPLYPYDFFLNPSGSMRGDWKVNDVIIEYAGLLDNPEYKAKMKAKLELADKYLLKIVVLKPPDIFDLNVKFGFLLNKPSQLTFFDQM